MVFGNTVDLNKLLCVGITSKAIVWVDSCSYLGIKLISEKSFSNDVQNRKFFGAVNNILSNGRILSEECLIELIHKQCLPILTYGCCNWNLNNEGKRQISVCFNRAIKKIFGYRDYESVKDILFGFKLLPIDLILVKSNLCLIGKALQSNRRVLSKCAEWCKCKKECADILMRYNVDFRLFKSNIVYQLWSHFTVNVNWV